jgi:hypothetical protein
MSLASVFALHAALAASSCVADPARLPAVAMAAPPAGREQRIDFGRRAACWTDAQGRETRALVLDLAPAAQRSKLVITLPIDGDAVLAARLFEPAASGADADRGFDRFDRRAESYTHTWYLPPSADARRIVLTIDAVRVGGSQSELRARSQKALPFPLSLAAPVNFEFGVEDTDRVRFAEAGEVRVRWTAAAAPPIRPPAKR